MKSLKLKMSDLSSVYTSLTQVLATLTLPEVYKHAEVQKLLKLTTDRGIIDQSKENFLPKVSQSVAKDVKDPFIVIEGLDGSGKTFLTQYLKERYGMILMQTPPLEFKEFRQFFDRQSEAVRRAFYSLGNYWAGENVLKCSNPVIMDRFWHSTVAYAVANELKSKSSQDWRDNGKFLEVKWPSDLLCPNLVLFLVVSEGERVRRHLSRHEFTNTREEQTLANDQDFRQNVINFYKSIEGPPLLEINADGSKNEVAQVVSQAVEAAFPSLKIKSTENIVI